MASNDETCISLTIVLIKKAFASLACHAQAIRSCVFVYIIEILLTNINYVWYKATNCWTSSQLYHKCIAIKSDKLYKELTT